MNLLSKPLFVTVGGYEPGGGPEYVEEVIEIEAGQLLKILPDMVRCIAGGLVPEIENEGHPFDGWQVCSMSIDNPEGYQEPNEPGEPE